MNTIPHNIPDDELSALVATEASGRYEWSAFCDKRYVAPLGWTKERDYGWKIPSGKERIGVLCADFNDYRHIIIPPYATSADAVLALVPRYGIRIDRDGDDWFVEINSPETPYSEGNAKTLPRAICLALLASKGFPVQL